MIQLVMIQCHNSPYTSYVPGSGLHHSSTEYGAAMFATSNKDYIDDQEHNCMYLSDGAKITYTEIVTIVYTPEE